MHLCVKGSSELPGSALSDWPGLHDFCAKNSSVARAINFSVNLDAAGSLNPVVTTGQPKNPVVTTGQPKNPVVTTGQPKNPVVTTGQLKNPVVTTGQPKNPVVTTGQPKNPVVTTGQPKNPVVTTGQPKESNQVDQKADVPLQLAETVQHKLLDLIVSEVCIIIIHCNLKLESLMLYRLINSIQSINRIISESAYLREIFCVPFVN